MIFGGPAQITEYLKMAMDQVRNKYNSGKDAFEETCKEADALLEVNPIDVPKLKAKCSTIQRSLQKLESIGEKLIDLLAKVDPAPLDELKGVEKSINDITSRAEEIQFRVDEATVATPTTNNVTTIAPTEAHHRLPKLELPKYGGEARDWLQFWGSFKTIHEDQKISKEHKFQYLTNCMVDGSDAQELIRSYPMTAVNYDEAVNSLQERFGRDDMLVEVYVRDLITLILENARNRDASFSSLYVKLSTQLRSLHNLGVTSDKSAAILYPMVESTLSEEVFKAWERYRHQNLTGDENKKSETQLQELMKFLKNEVEGSERLRLARTSFSSTNATSKSERTRPRHQIPTAASLITTEEKGQICIFCGGRHLSEACCKAMSMSIDERKKIIQDKRCCFSCLRAGHPSKNCRATVKCISCGGRHWIIICPQFSQPTQGKLPDKDKTKKSKQSMDLCNVYDSTETLMPTLSVYIHGEHKKKLVRLMFDSGSSKSYVLQKTAKEVGMKKTDEEDVVHLLFGGRRTEVRHHNRYKLHLSDLDETFFCNFDVSDEQVITGDICGDQLLVWYKQLQNKGIRISRELNQDSLTSEIAVLVGSDVYARLLTGRIIELEGGPMAIETRLGWTISGKMHCHNPSRCSTYNAFSYHMTDLRIKDLWELDVIGILDPVVDKSRQELTMAAVDFFKSTTARNSDGRYVIKLPFIEGHDPIPSYQYIAMHKLKSTRSSLEKKKALAPDLPILKAYHGVFTSWEKEGIIERVTTPNTGHYLSHHGVIKTESSTTPVRPVFNASFRTKGNPSLNDCLEIGPNMLEEIPAILCRFRLGPIGITADIKKAFLQIEVAEEDRDFLRFLWYSDENMEHIQEFRHCRVVFGVNCSPFLLAATIDNHLSNCSEEYQETASTLKKSFYVDNCVASFQTNAAALKFQEQSTGLLNQAMMDLRGWEIGPSEEEKEINILGMTWNTNRDELYCDLKKPLEKSKDLCSTRRKMLSASHSVFDPLGLLSPFTIIPKMIIQETAKFKIGWDKPLPDEITKQFTRWTEQIHKLERIKIPRCITASQDKATWSLHVFSDSSSSAYAACAYLRSGNPGEVNVQLLMSRARVAPLKPTTIPRLELIGCLCGARLADMVKKMIEFPDLPVILWTDSTTALCWIQNDKNWTTFVSNRVKEIRRLTDTVSWRHIPGKENPADLPSRGTSAKSLLESTWWEGPFWLKYDEFRWPSFIPTLHQDEVDSEMRKTIVSHMNLQDNSMLTQLNKMSSYFKIVRVVAYCRRFLQFIKDKFGASKDSSARIQKGLISTEEFITAEEKVIKLIQQQNFPGGTKDAKLSNIVVHEDETGIIRRKTRIFPGEEMEYASPIVLPNKDSIVQKLIMSTHLNSMHAGAQLLISSLREKYWILSHRRTISQAIRGCSRCRRFRARAVSVPEGPLPLDRLKLTRAFDVTGVDMAGPLYLKGNKKVWIAVFSCAVTRGVHLELCSGLTTEVFISSLRRFIARRGRPSTVYSDNGLNFVGTANMLKNLDWNNVLEFATLKQINWKFNPPTASWWGGFWERIIGIIKPMLRSVLGSARVNNEQLSTILCDIESTINNRPLTYTLESDELVPLTPDLLIRNCGKSEVADLDAIDRKHVVLQYRNIQSVREELRRRFQKEYLAMLVHTCKNRKSRNVTVGEIVLIGCDNKKRLEWPMGRVEEVMQGRDGQVRVARLKTQGGELLRPVQRLYPLEIN